jgi:predicted dehydrogenase
VEQKHILILGTGSVGKRHAINLSSLGCTISCMDTRSDRLEEVKQEIDVVGTYRSIEEAFSDSLKKYDGVVVASPPVFHVDQSIAVLEHEIPVLLEKPVSPDEVSARRLQDVVNNTGIPLLLGYTWRWWPPLVKVRELIENETIGKLRYVQFMMSAHLADWHPWENYWDFFMASKDLGGGALLDESHWIDLMLWFFGAPESLFAKIDKVSDLKIDTDDNVDMVITYKDGLYITIHLDIYGRPHEKYIRFIGEKGTILWTAEPNRVSVGKDWSQTWETHDFACERNDMFVEVGKEFIDILNGSGVKTCDINDGVRVISLIEAARQSSAEGRVTELNLLR